MLTPELSAVMAGSFHLVILLLKMPEITAGVSTSLSTPCRLYATAMAPPTMGMSMAGPAAQRASALGRSASLRAESDPAKAVWLLMKSWTPAPDPFAW